MDIETQVEVLTRIKADLQKEYARLEDGPAKVEVQAQVEALTWAIKTLTEAQSLTRSLAWLSEVVR